MACGWDGCWYELENPPPLSMRFYILPLLTAHFMDGACLLFDATKFPTVCSHVGYFKTEALGSCAR